MILGRVPVFRPEPDFRVKAFLRLSVERVVTGPDGLPMPWDEGLDEEKARRELAAAVLKLEGVLKRKVKLDTEVCEFHFDPRRARVNGADFDAEDGVYRGPFDLVLTVGPGDSAETQLLAANRARELRTKFGLWPLRATAAKVTKIPVGELGETVVPLAVTDLDEAVVAEAGGWAPRAAVVPKLTEAEVARRKELEALMTPSRQLAEDLRSDSMNIRFSACRVFTRLKDPAAFPLLRAAMLGASPLVSQMAVRAIKFQGGVEAEAHLIDIVRSAPDDLSRLEAAQGLAVKGDNGYNSVLATLLTCKTAFGRAESVRVLAKIGTPETAIVAVTFLRDTEPEVRLAVVSSVPMTTELPAKAALYAAINDPSEAVRAAACGRLRQSEFPEIRAEAERALRGENAFVRAGALEFATQAQIFEALSGPSSDVRRVAWSKTDRALDAEESDKEVLREIAAFPGELPVKLRERLSKIDDPVVSLLRSRSFQTFRTSDSPKIVSSRKSR